MTLLASLLHTCQAVELWRASQFGVFKASAVFQVGRAKEVTMSVDLGPSFGISPHSAKARVFGSGSIRDLAYSLELVALHEP